jgi:hypothetical protein
MPSMLHTKSVGPPSWITGVAAKEAPIAECKRACEYAGGNPIFWRTRMEIR